MASALPARFTADRLRPGADQSSRAHYVVDLAARGWLSQVCRDHPRRRQRSCNAASVRRIRERTEAHATVPQGTLCTQTAK